MNDLRVRSCRPSPFPLRQRVRRGLWRIVWLVFFRPTPRPCHGWRRFLLKLFGGEIGRGAKIYPSARIWAPWNLVLEERAVIGDFVDCYCVAPIRIGAESTVSQYGFLCTASHDPEDPGFGLIARPIVVEDQVWIAADVFVGPGVTIRQGSVVGARSSVFADLPPWKICVGSPAKPVRDRIVRAKRG